MEYTETLGWFHSMLHRIIKLIKITFPSSIPVLLSLPKNQGLVVVKKSPKLLQAIDDHFESLPAHQRGRRDLVQLRRLVEDAKHTDE